jgi:hypothetical protein
MTAASKFSPGDRVRLTTDTFQGKEGIVKAVNPDAHLILVAVKAYGTTIAVEVDFDSLEPFDHSEVIPPPTFAPDPPSETPMARTGPKIPLDGKADRAVFVCHQGGYSYSVGVAVHRGGRQALDYLRYAAPRLQRGDPMASAARLCGVLHELLDGSRFLTLHPPPRTREDGSVDWKAYGQGDAGVIVVDVANGTVECRAGYLENQQIEPLQLSDRE